MKTSEMIEVMQAYERGEQIEYRERGSVNWITAEPPTWNWEYFDYRIKPKPKYRPYKDAKEFLNAQEKHGMWLESSEVPSCYFMPVRVFPEAVQICGINADASLKPRELSFKELLINYNWRDNQKCGVKLP